MDIPIGQDIELNGRFYRVESRLGGGSQGQVFRGVDEDGQYVALKFITDPRRQNREALILSGWDCVHIVRLLHHGPWQDGELLVMDLVDGLTLQRIQELLDHLKKGLHPALALEIITHVARGLEEGYRTLRLKVHRDIKPSNVMLARDGMAKLLDFGIAYGLDLTITGTPVATPLYMAPEQMEGARPTGDLDHRTDQYSLGLLLCELVLGKPLRPLDRDALARWLFVAGTEWSAARDRISRQAPEALLPLERLMAWEPERRYTSMQEAITALERARRAIGEAPPLAPFAARIVEAFIAGHILSPLDPAFVALVGEGSGVAETLLPDPDGDPAPWPQKISPARERELGFNLADLRKGLVATPARTPGARSAEVVPAVARTPLLGREDPPEAPPPPTGLPSFTPEQRPWVWAAGALFLLLIALALWSSISDALRSGERPLRGRGAGVFVTPGPPPRAIAPLAPGEEPPPPLVPAAQAEPSPTPAPTAPPPARLQGSGAKAPAHPRAQGKGAAAPPTAQGKSAVPTEWRTTIPGVEPLPVPVVSQKRPGEDLKDEADPGAEQGK